jgi:nitroreductase
MQMCHQIRIRRIEMTDFDPLAGPGVPSSGAAASFDRIIRLRRSIRKFKTEVPPQETIDAILEAGLLAPYASLARPSLADCRRFLVLTRGTRVWAEAERLMNTEVARLAGRLRWAVRLPLLRQRWEVFAKRMEKLAANGLPEFGTAPIIIIVAERHGYPRMQKQSLAHAMENMWLAATAFGLGFQLFSMVEVMAKHHGFMALLRLEAGAWDLYGCALGYPAQEPCARKLLALSEVVNRL